MANQRVDIVVAAKDQASGKLMGIAKAALGMGAAFLGWSALKGAVTSVVGAYMEAEQQEKKLQQALKATGNAAGFTFDQLKQYAASLQNTTDFEGDAISEMMSVLVTFKNVQGPIFTEGTSLILDMAKAMGGDLQSTAIQVGKALNDPVKGITALSRAGVSFTDLQKQQIVQFVKQNELASAQKIILGELASEFGGQAAAAAQTFGGQLKQLANDWGDATEEMGSMIANIPGMGTGMDWLRTVFQNFGLSMDIVWTATALGMVKFWEEMKFTFTQRIPAMAMWFLENWKNIFTTLWSFTSSVFTNMWTNVKNFFTATWSWLKGEGFDFEWTGLLEGFESTLTQLPELVRDNKSAVEEALEKELADLKGQFQQKFQEVVNPTLNVPMPSMPGGSQDLAAETKKGKGPAAVEGRFLSGNLQATDYQKETAQNGRRQVTLLERMVARLEAISRLQGQAQPGGQIAMTSFR
jgi:hypothetical protein